MNLSNNDYIKIVKNYGIVLPKTKKGTTNINKTKKLAKKILADKLCTCIKKVTRTSKLRESGAIAICNKSIFTRRNIKHFRFTCKKRNKLLNKKGTKNALEKTKNKIF